MTIPAPSPELSQITTAVADLIGSAEKPCVIDAASVDLEDVDWQVFDGAPPLPVSVVKQGKRHILCLSIPARLFDGRTKYDKPLLDRDRDYALKTIANTAAITLLPRDATGSLVIAHVGIDSEKARAAMEQCERVAKKRVLTDADLASPQALRAALAVMPGIGSPVMFLAHEAPVWLTRIAADGLGPLSEVDLNIPEGPGLTILSGGNATGKTTILAALEHFFIQDGDGLLTVEATDSLPPSGLARLTSFAVRRTSGTRDDAAACSFRDVVVPTVFPTGVDTGIALALREAVDTRMPAWRRMMRYGEADGGLPPWGLSSGLLECESLGRIMLASALAPQFPAGSNGAWTGIALDCALDRLDTIRQESAIQIILRAAQSRQVILTTRDNGIANWVQRMATTLEVPVARCDLNQGDACIRQTGAPSLKM